MGAFTSAARARLTGDAVWVDKKESFYCGLDTCTAKQILEPNRNTTKNTCENIKCRCIPGRMMCGEKGSLYIGDFLKEEIKGPASFSTVSTEGGSPEDGSEFHEPAMDKLILQVFGEDAIFLNCFSGECLYKTKVPGYERPTYEINRPLIAGIVAGCAILLAFTILSLFYLVR